MGDVDRIRGRAEGWHVARALGLQQRGLHYFCPACQMPALQVGERQFMCQHCGQQGDLVALVRLTRHCTLQEAVEWLASRERSRDEGSGPGDHQRVPQQVWLETEQRFQAVFEQAAVGLALATPNGQWLLVNHKLSEITGYSQEALLSRTFQDITYPEDLAADLALAQQVLAGEIATYSIEKRYIHKDGHLFWINLTVSLVREASGIPKYFVAVIEDIDARKRAEQYLAAAADVSRALLESRTKAEGLQQALEIIGRQMHWHVGAAWCVADDGKLHCVQTWHDRLVDAERLEVASRRMTLQPGQGFIGHIWSTGQAHWISDIHQDPRYTRRQAALKDHFHGAFGFPLRTQRGIVGVIEFVSYAVRPPDDQLLRTVATIGNVLGQFVEKKDVETKGTLPRLSLEAIPSPRGGRPGR